MRGTLTRDGNSLSFWRREKIRFAYAAHEILLSTTTAYSTAAWIQRSLYHDVYVCMWVGVGVYFSTIKRNKGQREAFWHPFISVEWMQLRSSNFVHKCSTGGILADQKLYPNDAGII